MQKNSILKQELLRLLKEDELTSASLNNRITVIKQMLRLLDEGVPVSGNLLSLANNDLINQIGNNDDFIGYPKGENLLAKLHYYEDRENRVWKIQAATAFLEKAEGSKRAFNNMAQKINYYVKKNQMISLKYNNSRLYTFYTTRYEWVEGVTKIKGKFKATLVPGHEPLPQELSNLTDEQKNNELIEWGGLHLN